MGVQFRDVWSSQVQAQLKAATLANYPRPRSDFEPLCIRWRASFEANRIKSGWKSDRKQLKIRSGSPLVLRGRLLWGGGHLVAYKYLECISLDASVASMDEKWSGHEMLPLGSDNCGRLLWEVAPQGAGSSETT